MENKVDVVSEFYTDDHIDMTYAPVVHGSPGKGEFLTQLLSARRTRRRVADAEKLDALNLFRTDEAPVRAYDLALAESVDLR